MAVIYIKIIDITGFYSPFIFLFDIAGFYSPFIFLFWTSLHLPVQKMFIGPQELFEIFLLINFLWFVNSLFPNRKPNKNLIFFKQNKLSPYPQANLHLYQANILMFYLKQHNCSGRFSHSKTDYLRRPDSNSTTLFFSKFYFVYLYLD